jgi:hypothetical protein
VQVTAFSVFRGGNVGDGLGSQTVADDHSQYAVVSSRRLQWDNLVWQVPMMGLTAQAFLFTTALGAGDRWARVIASLLAVVTSLLSITLMARHRQAEIADSHWLEDYERTHFGEDSVVHGKVFAHSRNDSGLQAGRFGELIPLLPGFKTWVSGLLLFAVAGVVALVRALVTL